MRGKDNPLFLGLRALGIAAAITSCGPRSAEVTRLAHITTQRYNKAYTTWGCFEWDIYNAEAKYNPFCQENHPATWSISALIDDCVEPTSVTSKNLVCTKEFVLDEKTGKMYEVGQEIRITSSGRLTVSQKPPSK